MPSSGVTTGATDAGLGTMSIPSDYEHMRGAAVAAGAPGPDGGTMLIPSHCKRGPGTIVDAVDPFTVRFYIDDGILVGVGFFQDGRRLRSDIESLASDCLRLLGTRGPRTPLPVGAHWSA